MVNLHSQPQWKREETNDNIPLMLFHSTHVINMPTTETLQKGDLEFEVSHRFVPTIQNGIKNMFGFDGPANIKLGLSYGITDNLLLGLNRTNVNDNYELFIKHRFIEVEDSDLPFVIGVKTSVALNSEVLGKKTFASENFQYYLTIIFNTMYEKKIALGFVPSLLINSYLPGINKNYSIIFGTYLQYYLSPSFSLATEWSPTFYGIRNKYNSLSFGFELETGGHFFKIILTNNQNLNLSQFLGGADIPSTFDNWRIGFNITRLLKL